MVAALDAAAHPSIAYRRRPKNVAAAVAVEGHVYPGHGQNTRAMAKTGSASRDELAVLLRQDRSS
ncbi:hypothetical protein A5641_13095 [Mycobacterium sp. 1554424.7]|nr:hypothetical protein A5641_13095 [Mycobacterium sp. 1554424.7]